MNGGQFNKEPRADELLLTALFHRLHGRHGLGMYFERRAQDASDYTSVMLGRHQLAVAKRVATYPQRIHELWDLLSSAWDNLRFDPAGTIEYHLIYAHIMYLVGNTARGLLELDLANRLMDKHPHATTRWHREHYDYYLYEASHSATMN
jgi:hypothetical protein